MQKIYTKSFFWRKRAIPNNREKPVAAKGNAAGIGTALTVILAIPFGYELKSRADKSNPAGGLRK
jgi:hypothetical protein